MNKILLVEDDDMLGMVLNDQLEMNGYEVSLLKWPARTIDYLREDSFDLVLMDKLLNGVDGTQVCKEIRNTDGISQVPILMMSGMDGAGEVCISAGATAFIAKPFEVSNLLESIKSSIARAKELKN